MANETPAGWYPAPDSTDLVRYWDGEIWTDQARPAPNSSARGARGHVGTPTAALQKSDMIKAALEPGEAIEAGFNSGSVRITYFVATDSRVLVFMPQGVRGKKHAKHVFGFDELDTVGLDKWGNFELTVNGESFTGWHMGSGVVDNYIEFLRYRMPGPGSVDLSSLPAPQSPDSLTSTEAVAGAPMVQEPTAVAPSDEADEDSLGDQLAQLAKLHTDGFLTEEEFAAAKAKVLAS